VALPLAVLSEYLPSSNLWATLTEAFAPFVEEHNAETRSIELLKDWLTPEQRTQFESTGKFSVVGSQSGDRYWIEDGSTSFNVVRIHPKKKQGTQRYCFVPATASAKGDVMLAQKIMLETNEPEALRIANKYHPNDGNIYGCLVRAMHIDTVEWSNVQDDLRW
jgi:hypothetical protein